MVDARAKGQRGEYAVRDLLREHTGLQWERTPASGALEYLKGDLYIPNEKPKFVIEVKNYKDSALNDKILTNTTNNLNIWWTKLLHQAEQNKCEPLLFFKYDRSKIFVATQREPRTVINYLCWKQKSCYSMLAEEFLIKEWKHYATMAGYL
jgi:Holliday junction resolvase